MFKHKGKRPAWVVGAVVVVLLLAVSIVQEAPAKNAGDTFGLVTRHGVCVKPPLGKKLGVPSTTAVRLVPPRVGFQGDDSGAELERFRGVAHVVIDTFVEVDGALVAVDALVEIDDIRQLTPCAVNDRLQCVEESGTASFADGTTVKINPGDRLEAHAIWEFDAHAITWATVNGRAAEVLDTRLTRCEG